MDEMMEEMSEDMQELIRMAEEGDQKMMLILAGFYVNSESEYYDPEKAIYWIERLAQSGDLKLQYHMYERYRDGIGVPEDSDKAWDYLTLAAEQGHPKAMYEMGMEYLIGGGYAEQDVKKGKYLIQKAAAKGNVHALYRLGMIYRYDVRNDERAAECFYWASMRKNWRAQMELGHMYGSGEVFPKDHSEQLYWYEKAAESGHYEAYTNLALMYHNGFFGKTEPDEEKSEYYEKLSREAREREQEESGMTEEEWLEEHQFMIDSEIEERDEWNAAMEQWIEEEEQEGSDGT